MDIVTASMQATYDMEVTQEDLLDISAALRMEDEALSAVALHAVASRFGFGVALPGDLNPPRKARAAYAAVYEVLAGEDCVWAWVQRGTSTDAGMVWAYMSDGEVLGMGVDEAAKGLAMMLACYFTCTPWGTEDDD